MAKKIVKKPLKGIVVKRKAKLAIAPDAPEVPQDRDIEAQPKMKKQKISET